MNNLIYEMKVIDSSNDFDDLDYFIFSSSSDSRAYEVLSKIDLHNVKPIIIHFNERIEGKSGTDTIFNFSKFKLKNLQEIFCEIRKPSSCLEGIRKNVFTKLTKVGLDISCLTKPYFYFLLKLLKERFGVKRINIFYTEPKSYLFPNGLFETFSSSSGPLSVIEIPGFSGQAIRGFDPKLIILLGFDGDLSKEIKVDVAPKETIVVNGFPSYSPKFKDISLITNEKLVSDHGIKVKYARANNPFEVYNLLESIKSGSQNTFLNIAPLGTKPMALGACLFALHNPDVRVVYPLPEKYEDEYSDKCWSSWVYLLPLEL